MYIFASTFENDMTVRACLPEQQIQESLTDLLDLCDESYEPEFLTTLQSWIDNLPQVLFDLQTSGQSLELRSNDGRVLLKLAVDKLGHYTFELSESLSDDWYVAQVTWINPII